MDYTDLTWDEVDSDALQKVWKARAERLALPTAQEEQGSLIDLVIVRFGNELFGLEARNVNTIRLVGQVTPIPRVPDWVLGVVNLRGSVLSLIDLARFYHLRNGERPVKHDPKPVGEEAPSMVVVEANGMQVALLADEVLTVEAFPVAHIRDAGDILPHLPKEAVNGILFSQFKTMGNDPVMVIVLNVPAVLADKRLIVNEELT